MNDKWLSVCAHARPHVYAHPYISWVELSWRKYDGHAHFVLPTTLNRQQEQKEEEKERKNQAAVHDTYSRFQYLI